MSLRKVSLLVVMVTSMGCKAKEKDGNPPAAGSGSGAPATVAPPAGPAVTLDATAPFGCVAWQAARKAAACVTGYRGTSGASVDLVYLGMSEPPTKLVESDLQFDHPPPAEAALTKANAVLAKEGFTLLAGTKHELTAGTPLELDKVSVTWTRQQTHEGGDNQPPSHDNQVIAACHGKKVGLFGEVEEGDNPAVWVRAIGDHVIVEILVGIAREGEMVKQFDVAVLDTTTCMVAKS